MKKENEILEEAIIKAQSITKSKSINFDRFPNNIRNNIDVMLGKIDSNKSILASLATSCVKKIIDPKQDIRLHRTDFKGGYSARSLDTAITTPFFKKYFPKYANKESSFLTLATRERIKWTKKDGVNLKIRDKKVKNSFLILLDDIQRCDIKPGECLVYIFAKLLLLTQHIDLIFDETIEAMEFSEIININTVIKMLEKHFKTKLSSRLPVIAIYTIYQMLLSVIKRYDGKILSPLNVHTSSDKHGFGDVEIWNTDKTPFEMVEIKHNIPIKRNMVFDIVKKTKNTAIQRYYLLTTYEGCFSTLEEENYINKFILKIKNDGEIEIIANGIIQSLKYYMRFIEDYVTFIKKYTSNLIEDAKISTEVKEFHIKDWQDILKEHEIKY
ncbi:MAG: DNA methyltransferase [Elusimicrobia bacterium CG1_02_37_114]|nr:MAG: DNA methyltransferase [Elusimicrobia bacterium CG1_02_37_114]PIV53258.1 MAG: DNA methyltransferase [Elusimicrobia bacterium CG02_land_8_20_14_3_00_37_13]PIZ12548.1 MAG: DNA methyltransferase [Elusimicrobia bacterium CG_4_10_14_0_8_um_filter_37_32]